MRQLLAKYFTKVNEGFVKKRKLKPVEESKNQWFYLEFHDYKGEDVLLADGSLIQRGDKVAEIHINNVNVTQHMGDLRFIFRVLEDECRAIANAISKGHYGEIKAYQATTLLYPFAEKKGFEVREVKSKLRSLQLGIWESLIKYALEKKKSKFKLRRPAEIWISRDKIMKLYAN